MDFLLQGVPGYLAVALIALSPVGEELVAIPAGLALGLNPFITALVAMAANWLPGPVLIWGGDYLIKRWAFLGRWQRKSGTVQKWVSRFGIWAVVLITPWIGIYTTSLGGVFIGMKKTSLLAAITASLAIYAAAAALAATGLISWLKTLI